MKRTLMTTAAVLLCLCILSGCTGSAALSESFSTDGFGDFLDAEHFVPKLDQGNFFEQLETYCLNGEPISLGGYFYDGLTGGGRKANGRLYGACNDYTVTDNETRAIYTNQFYTKIALEGL